MIFTGGPVFTGPTRWTRVITATSARRTTAAIAFWTFLTLATGAGRAALTTRRTRGMLVRLLIVRTLVRVDRGGMMILGVVF